MTDRQVGWEQNFGTNSATRCWLSDDSISWEARSAFSLGRKFHRRIFEMVAGKYAACGWLVVQMVVGHMPVEFRGAVDHQESGDLGATYGLVQFG